MLVSDLLERCTAHELQEWNAFLSISPEELQPKEGIEEQFMKALGVKRGG